MTCVSSVPVYGTQLAHARLASALARARAAPVTAAAETGLSRPLRTRVERNSEASGWLSLAVSLDAQVARLVQATTSWPSQALST